MHSKLMKVVLSAGALIAAALIRRNDSSRLLKSIGKLLDVTRDASPAVSYHVVPDIFGRNFHLLTDVREEPLFREVAEPVVSMGRSFLYYDRLYNLYESISNVSRAPL